MFSLEIQVQDEASPHLQRTLAELQHSRPLMQKIGEELARAIRAHFMRRDSEPNAKGWPKRHFWSQEGRRNTALSYFDATEAVVSIASPAIAHKLYGGTVRPKRGRALAIPASAEAYKAIQPSAMDRDMLEFVPLQSGGLIGMLIERQHDMLRKVKGRYRPAGIKGRRGGKIWFWLVAKATHRPDPNTLPPYEELRARAGSAADEFLQAILDRNR